MLAPFLSYTPNYHSAANYTALKLSTSHSSLSRERPRFLVECGRCRSRFCSLDVNIATMPIPGHATIEGTTRYRDRFQDRAAKHHFRQQQHLLLSSIGIGTYLC